MIWDSIIDPQHSNYNKMSSTVLCCCFIKLYDVATIAKTIIVSLQIHIWCIRYGTCIKFTVMCTHFWLLHTFTWFCPFFFKSVLFFTSQVFSGQGAAGAEQPGQRVCFQATGRWRQLWQVQVMGLNSTFDFFFHLNSLVKCLRNGPAQLENIISSLHLLKIP